MEIFQSQADRTKRMRAFRTNVQNYNKSYLYRWTIEFRIIEHFLYHSWSDIT